MLKATIILLIFLIGQTSYAESLQLNQKDNSISLADLKALQNEDTEEYSRVFFELEEKYRANKSKRELAGLYQLHASYLMQVNQYDSLINLLHTTRMLLGSSDFTQLSKIYLDLAFAHYFLENYDSLLYWEKNSEKLIDSGSPLFGRVLLISGYRSVFDGAYVEAIGKTLKALEIFEKNNDLTNLGLAFNSLALNYDRLGDFQKQHEYLLKSIEIHKKTGDIENLILNYNNLGSNYKQKGELTEALYYYDLAFNELVGTGNSMLLAQNLTNRANIFEALEDYNEAEKLFLECKKICVDNQIGYGMMLSNLNLGNLYRLKKQFSKSKKHLEDGLSLAIEMKLRKETALAYERLSWLNRDINDYKKAYEYFNSFYFLNDSLRNESIRNQANELKEKYESEKKENEIISLSKEKLYQRYIISLLILGLVVLIFVVYSWRQKYLRHREERQREEERLKFQLEMKEKELLSDSLKKVSVMHTKESIAKDLKNLLQEMPKSQSQKFSTILKELKTSHDDRTLEEFESRFLGVYEGFFVKLRQIAPDLTPTEQRVAALIRLNFSSKEMAMITKRSAGTIDNIRSNIRKKLNLEESDDLAQRLTSLK